MPEPESTVVEGSVEDEVTEADAVTDQSHHPADPAPASTAVARRREVPALSVTPEIGAEELVSRLDTIRKAQDEAMEKDVDYGVIPGTNKPSLLKPGAEKLSVLFQLDVQLTNEKVWDDDHLTVISHATVFHAPSGARLGYGEGICTTRERKYAYRKQERTCPDCGEHSVIKGKQEYGGGWLCWKKKGGCGNTWTDDSDQGKAFAELDVSEIANPDLPDVWNTVVKMAEKRARVDAVLAVTGASALFTQDVEDTGRDPESSGDAPLNFGPPVEGERKSDAVRAITYLMDGHSGVAEAAWEGIKGNFDGQMPDRIAGFLIAISASLHTFRGDVKKAEGEGSESDASSA